MEAQREVSVPVFLRREGISKPLNVIEIRQVQAEWRRVIGNQAGTGEHFASQQVEIEVVVLHQNWGELNSFNIQASIWRKPKVEREQLPELIVGQRTGARNMRLEIRVRIRVVCRSTPAGGLSPPIAFSASRSACCI